MAFRPVSVDDPDAEGTNWPATWVSPAIRSLDDGDTSGATHKSTAPDGSNEGYSSGWDNSDDKLTGPEPWIVAIS
jgi:hypothetical protein